MFDYLVGPSYLNPLIRVAATVSKDLYEGRSFKDNSYSAWLTNGEWDESKYTEYLVNTVLPGMREYTQFLVDFYDDKSYMDRQGIDWSNVRHPWKFKSSNSASSGMRYGYHFVSDNIKRLYK